MVTNNPKPTDEAVKKEETSANDMVVLDIGKHQTASIKKLRKGKGKLLRKVNNAIGQLRDNGNIKPDAQVVIVVAREKGAGLLDVFD